MTEKPTSFETLAGHERITRVNYPGLASHPDHARAAELFDGFGSMMSFRPVGGVPPADLLVKSLRPPYAAPSLGGVESLVTRAATGGHSDDGDGIDDDLIRFSAGIEATENLVSDFANALA